LAVVEKGIGHITKSTTCPLANKGAAAPFICNRFFKKRRLKMSKTIAEQIADLEQENQSLRELQKLGRLILASL
jgi:hypothetical protein